LPATKPALWLPQNDDECRALESWARNTPAEQRPATRDQLARHLEFLAATLPSKHVDDRAGKMRVAVYVSMLAGYSDEALAFMTRRACAQLDWFPTPRQCLEILKGYWPSPSESECALSLCHEYRHGRLHQFLDGLRNGALTQGQVDSKPRRWRMIAMEQGYLRLLDDGRLVLRGQKQLGVP
jgi:hypothetical protein